MATNDVGKRQSRQSRNYGHKAEQALIERYSLVINHESWKDAERQNGSPVEIKAAKHRMANGREGRYLIREDSHERLQAHNGWYGFVVYRPAGKGIEVLDMKMRQAAAVRIKSWQQINGRQNEKQIRISEVFR